jgi:hypothetical protein
MSASAPSVFPTLTTIVIVDELSSDGLHPWHWIAIGRRAIRSWMVPRNRRARRELAAFMFSMEGTRFMLNLDLSWVLLGLPRLGEPGVPG